MRKGAKGSSAATVASAAVGNLQDAWTVAHGLGAGVQDPWRYANDQGDATLFQQRASMAMTAGAVAVSQEDPATTNHAARVVLARAVLNDPATWTVPFAQALASHGVTNSDTDQVLSQGVRALWDAMAGA